MGSLIVQLEEALLNSHKYKEACTFAAQRAAKDPSVKQSVIAKIVNKAEALANPAGDRQSLEDAVSLIKEALDMTPPLDEGHQKDLRRWTAEATVALAKLRQSPPA